MTDKYQLLGRSQARSLDYQLAAAVAGKDLFANIILLDRSRIADREACPQRREYGYDYPLGIAEPQTDPTEPPPGHVVHGIQRVRKSVPLATGIAVHEGLSALATWFQNGWVTVTPDGTWNWTPKAISPHGISPVDPITQAVNTSLDIYRDEVSTAGFGSGTGPTSGTHSWIIQEQSAIIQALVRVGALRILPSILTSGHTVVSVESERVTWLGEDRSNNTTFLYLSRADLEMYDPLNNQLYVINYKTAKSWDARDQDRLVVNLQTIGEPAALRASSMAPPDLRSQYPELSHIDPSANVAGVQYIILLKGIEKYDQSRGHDVLYSHFTRAWTAINPSNGRPIYTWRYYHTDSRRQILSKATGFHPFESYPGGTRQWIQDLSTGLITGGDDAGDPLQESIVMPAMCYMHPDRLHRWQRQTLRDEIRYHADQQAGEFSSQHSGSCGTGKWRCQFWKLCWEGEQPEGNPDFEPRKPNHPEPEQE